MTVVRLIQIIFPALCVVAAVVLMAPSAKGQNQTSELAAKLIALKSNVFNADEAASGKTMLDDDIVVRMRAASAAESAAFAKVATATDWEKFRDQRLAALKETLAIGAIPPTPAALPAGVQEAPGKCQITGTFQGDGFRIVKLAIAGRPGLPITANLYLPTTPPESMPGILIVTSHHNPKNQSELQDMGMTWARSGCAVIIADNIGYGERRQQPYGGREDYRWRYYMGMQLHTVGQSMLGWMVADQMRVLDVLAAQPGVDPKRLISIGSVAGGGDIAAVLAALDHRVACSIPFNYGAAVMTKPVARTANTFAPGAELPWVNFVGGGDFDPVPCLRNHGRDGFCNWLICAAAAPRYMIYAKEFHWTPAGDEGYGRIAHIFELLDAAEHLDSLDGVTDVYNVGAIHCKAMYPILARWMNMPVPTPYQKHLDKELICLNPENRAIWNPRPVNEILAELGAGQIGAARAALAQTPPQQRREQLRRLWAQKLGNIVPVGAPEVKRDQHNEGEGFLVHRILLAPEPTIRIPLLLLEPPGPSSLEPAEKPHYRSPVVLCVAQQGKNFFLAKRAMEVADLLTHGVAVCVVDVRGTGETVPEGDRNWYSSVVEAASCDLVLGQTLLGSQVRDLRSVLMHLRSREDIDGRNIAIWGDSMAPVNPHNFIDPPLKTDVSALMAEPMGATAALLVALFEDDIKGVLARGGLTSYAALLDGAACHVVLDAIVPQALETGDLGTLVASLSPLPLRLEAQVDGRNRLVAQDHLERDYAAARAAYQSQASQLVLSPAALDDVADWFASLLIHRK